MSDRHLTLGNFEDIKNSIEPELYKLMDKEIGCGPFDGGCLIIARALNQILEGEIYVLTRQDKAEHAVVMKEGKLWDWDGALPPREKITQFNSDELVKCDDFRPLNTEDLIYAADNQKIVRWLESAITDQIFS